VKKIGSLRVSATAICRAYGAVGHLEAERDRELLAGIALPPKICWAGTLFTVALMAMRMAPDGLVGAVDDGDGGFVAGILVADDELVVGVVGNRLGDDGRKTASEGSDLLRCKV
jgi:hypothetical protein